MIWITSWVEWIAACLHTGHSSQSQKTWDNSTQFHPICRWFRGSRWPSLTEETRFQPSFSSSSLLSPASRITTLSRGPACARWRGKAPTPPMASWLPRPGWCWRSTTNPWRRPKVEEEGLQKKKVQLKQQKPCLVFWKWQNVGTRKPVF